jgi:hypothetical protein
MVLISPWICYGREFGYLEGGGGEEGEFGYLAFFGLKEGGKHGLKGPYDNSLLNFLE